MITLACPCGLPAEYIHCCQPFHEGISHPDTPEKLMRARYSAYFHNKTDFIWETTHPNLQKKQTKKDIIEWTESTEWLGLEIVLQNENGHKGEVHFKAKYRSRATGEMGIHQEASQFIKENDKWLYLQGGRIPIAKSLDRNAPCPCGSGKKYKKCCAP
ncbi:MAG: YchJ family protein [Spirosomataceae bacterium]